MPGRVTLFLAPDSPLVSTTARDVRLVGRSTQCHVRLPIDDPSAAEYHLLLDLQPPTARLRLLDTADVFINDGLATPDGDHFLRDGDHLRVGRSVLIVRLEAPASCPRCGTELPLLPSPPAPRRRIEHGVCEHCLDEAPTDPRPPRSVRSWPPRCARCHDVIVAEVGPACDHDYNCLRCSGRYSTVFVRALSRLSREGRAFPPVIPGYTVDHLLGVGGMGVVYRAFADDGSPVALKILLPELSSHPIAREMFLREIRLMNRFDSHPNLLRLLAAGETDGMLWLASEFCELGNLRTLVAKKGGRVPPEIAITVTHAVLDGLMAFHAEGYVHRDLKPENLLLTNNSVVKIADLGLAHSFVRTPEETTLTARNAICGTPEFMPPEQVADYHAVTNRADLWSVAACLYFFLAGTVPRDAAPDANPLLVALTAPVVPLLRRDPSLPRELAAVLDRALHHDPYKRYPTALAFKEALSR